MSNLQSAHTERNTMATTSIGSAAVAWLVGGIGTCCMLVLPIPFGTLCTGGIFLIGNIVALVTGYMGRQQIQQEGGSVQDEQWANIGMILGIVGTIVGLGLVCLSVASIAGLALLGPGLGDVFSEINSGLVTPVP